MLEVNGNVKVAPEQIAGTWVNVGVLFGVTVTVIEAVEVHKLDVGVNEYVVVAVLTAAGDHVPTIPLFEVSGNVKAAPEQIAGIWVNVVVVIG